MATIPTDLTWNTGHFLTAAGAASVIIGQWAVFAFRVSASEKDRAAIRLEMEKDRTLFRAEISSLRESIEQDRLRAQEKGPTMLCSLHEQRITRLEEEMRVQYLSLKSDLDLILSHFGHKRKEE